MTTYGTNSNDTITGSSSDEIFHPLDGSDLVTGGGGNDTFYAEGGVLAYDTLIGGAGNDSFYFDGLTNATITTGSGKDVIYFDGVFPEFIVSDFDPNLDRIVIDNNFWIKNGSSVPALASIAANGSIGSDRVFVKITDTIANPTSSTDVASAIFNLNDATIVWPDAAIIAVGNATSTVLWRISGDSTPKIQSSQLDYLGTLAGLDINNFHDRILNFLNHAPTSTNDSATVAEDGQTLSGNVLDNDTDLDIFDSKSVTMVNASGTNVGTQISGTYGTLTLNADGGYSYTLDNNLASVQALNNGTSVVDTFNYTMADAWGDTSSANLTITIAGANDTPTLNAPVAANYADTATDDAFVDDTGTLAGADVDVGAVLTYGISGGTDNGTTVSKAGSFGTLTVTKATGAYSYVPNDAAIEALKTNASENFTVTVTDGIAAAATATFTVNITGANDTTTFGGTTTGNVTEDGTLTASGTLTATDRDGAGDAAITAQTNTTGTYGTFSIGTNGVWNYSLNNGAANVQALNVGQSVTDSFTIATIGDATQNIALTIAGANEAPTGAVSISGTAVQGRTLTAANTLADDDGLGVITYTWKSGAATLGAGSTYVLGETNVGQTINVVASYTDGYGTGESVASEAVGVKALVIPPDPATSTKDTLVGSEGEDYLDGGLGADKMKGGAGDDTYVVDNISDKITELSDGGNDEVLSSLAKYTLPKNVENLTLTGEANINGTGNTQDNILTGNAGSNTLDGGKGIDSFAGGDGNDTYLLDSLLETVIELNSEGTDLIKLKVNTTGSYNMADQADNVENLTLTGTGLINVTGNDSDNTIAGNAKANQLDGGAGADSLYGGLGKDTMTGGDGADQFIFNTALAKANVDTITDFISGTDTIALDDKIFKKLAVDGILDINLSDNFENISIAPGSKAKPNATGTNNFLLYDEGTGNLYYDADGSKSKAAVLIGVFDDGSGNHPALVGMDLMVV